MSILWRNLAMLISALFALTLSVPAYSQAVPKSLMVLVEDTGPQWQRCGIIHDSIEGAAQATLRYNRIKIELEDSNGPILYVAVNALHLGGSKCVANVSVSIIQFDTYPLVTGKFVSGQFQHCKDGSLLTGANMGARVHSAVQEHANNCLAKIELSDFMSTKRFYTEIIRQQSLSVE